MFFFYVVACNQLTTWSCLSSHLSIRLLSFIIGGFYGHYSLLFALSYLALEAAPLGVQWQHNHWSFE